MMKNRIAAIGLNLILFLSFVVIVVEVIPPAHAASIIYVDNEPGVGPGNPAENFTSIQDAIDNASAGDTVFVYNGTYYENVVVDKTINLTGEDRNDTIINGSRNGDVLKILDDWVKVSHFSLEYGGLDINDAGIELNNVENCNIFSINAINNHLGIFLLGSYSNIITNNNASNNWFGIHLDFSNKNNTIANNNASNNGFGIVLDYSSSNTIANNTASSNIYTGILLDASNSNTIANNTLVLNNKRGILLRHSTSNTITNNEMVDNGVYIWGELLEQWNTHFIDATNTVNGKPVYYWKNQTGGVVPLGAGQIILANSTNVVIENQNVSNGNIGIELGFSSNNKITNNNVSSNNYDGIYLYKSNYNIITNNNLSSNNGQGIYLSSSSNNTIINNNITSNNFNGIYLSRSNNNTLSNNNASSNNLDGIRFSYSTGNTITNNIVSLNNRDGIGLGSSHGNTISNNNVSNNQDGILIYRSSSNTIINNTVFSNDREGIGLAYSTSNTISNNNASYNQDGIRISVSSSNTIINNTASSNNRQGIYFWKSHSNTVTENIASSNTYGIYIEHSDSFANNIYHNNIKYNTNQASDDTNESNQWDNGYPLGGNYWSDYSGVDKFKGPNQDILGSDGLGDTPYIIDIDSQDNYPLMQPYKPMENYMILKQGWNLISTSIIQEEQNLIRVLGSIDGWYDAVQWYNPSNPNKPWNHHKVSKPFGNDLSEINEKMGFWIHITNPGETIFLYNGTTPTSNQTIQLHPGWNMVGYPSLTSHNRTVGLNNLTFDTHVDAIQWFDAGTKTWHFMGPDDYFVPGRGYWVHSKVDAEWEVPI